ncbi:MAG TPA: PEP-CTERM sorting domain-containing protein [Nostocaceae cyanobacterium]|nr:PEP-CTERM sorting domain-containing protein [Nostocaceae cyanobacterium]
MITLSKKISMMLGTALISCLLPLTFNAKPAAAANLVTNGSFEEPNIPRRSFRIFPSIPGWGVEFIGASGGIEIQDNIAGSPFDGDQFAELDSVGQSLIYQDLQTVIGQTYKLQFAFSPRPGIPQNILSVKWGDVALDPISASGVGLPDTQWKVFTYDLIAKSAITRLSFDNRLEIANGVGTYLDAVSVTSVTPVPEPTSMLGVLGISAVGATSLLKRKKTAKA